MLVFVILNLDHWNLFGIWCLGFGIYKNWLKAYLVFKLKNYLNSLGLEIQILY
jgi:hypothetical protein